MSDSVTKKIVLTGGGSAGHVTPNIALIPALRKAGYEIYYIGSYTGIEKKLIEDYNVPYFGIATGKLRRYSADCYDGGMLSGLSTLAPFSNVKALRSAQKAGYAITKASAKPAAYYLFRYLKKS